MRIVSLISGGIDSPVATYLMLRRGDDCICVHFDNRPFTDEKQLKKTKKLVSKLEEISGRKLKLYLVPHGETQLRFARETIRRYGCIFCRRMMFRVAEKIAEREGAKAIVTGESLGQVASQTLENILVEEEAVSIPIIRPLIGFDKVEIQEIARKIGTYEISIEPGLCCTIVPNKPATRSNVKIIRDEESRLDINDLVEKSVSEAEVV